jgi:hypothetical protein
MVRVVVWCDVMKDETGLSDEVIKKIPRLLVKNPRFQIKIPIFIFKRFDRGSYIRP